MINTQVSETVNFTRVGLKRNVTRLKKNVASLFFPTTCVTVNLVAESTSLDDDVYPKPACPVYDVQTFAVSYGGIVNIEDCAVLSKLSARLVGTKCYF